MRPERRRLGDDDSSGVSSASSACVSESGPTNGSQRRPDPEPDPAGGFSVFGDQLDLFTEILQTQQRLQQCQQTTLGSCGAESTLFCDSTPTSSDIFRVATLTSPDVIRAVTPTSPDVTRTASPPSSGVTLSSTPPSSDITHTATPTSSDVVRSVTPTSSDVIRTTTPPSSDLTGTATPPLSRVNRELTLPTSDVIRAAAPTSPNVTCEATPPSPDVKNAVEPQSELTNGQWGLSWVWGQNSGEDGEPSGDKTGAADEELDWARAGEQNSDLNWTPGLRESRDHCRRWDSDLQLDQSLELESDQEQEQEQGQELDQERGHGQEQGDRSPGMQRYQNNDVRAPVTKAVELSEELQGRDEPQGEPEEPRLSPEPDESLDESPESQRESEELLELLQWVGDRESELRELEQHPATGHLLVLRRQQEAAQSFLDLLKRREPSIGEALDAAGAPSRVLHLGVTGVNGTQVSPACGRAAALQDKWRHLLNNAERHNGDLQSTLAKMHVLERCMQDVERRLTELEEGPDDVITTDDVTGDRLLAVQRGLDDVNDQVARLTENGAPLSSERCGRVAALTSRLRQLSSAASGGLASLDLGRSVEPPWERSETEEGVPYYLHHGERRTQWNHPRLAHLLAGLSQLDNVRFSAYRTALKLRRLQRTLLLHRLPLAEAVLTFESEAWRLPCSGVAGVPDVLAVLTALYGRLQPPVSGASALPLRIDLCLNWLLSVFDSRRTGSIPVYCLKLAIAALSQAHLEEKYRYMFQLSADSNRRLDARRLSRLLRRLLQLPGQLSEAAAFGPEQVAPSVASCLTSAGQSPEDPAAALTEDELLAWLRAEPQSVVWLPVLHRVAGAESARHQARCNTCKLYPIVGFRYRCLKCFNYDMCQQCFFTGRISKGHKLSHPLHEYCTESSSSDGLRDLARSIRNRFKSKQHFKKHPKLAYLPVQSTPEGDSSPAEPDAPAASVEKLGTLEELEKLEKPQLNGDADPTEAANNSNVFSSPDSEEELQLITQYCLGLWPAGGEEGQEEGAAPEEHLRAVIRHLEQENRALQAEYRRLTGPGATGTGTVPSTGTEPPALLNISFQTEDSRPGTPDWSEDRSTEDDQLRNRMQLLDQQNRQLGQQLSQLRRLMNGGGTNLVRSSTLQTRAVTAAYLASDGPKQVPASPGGKLSRTKRLALSLARRNGHTAEIMA